MFDKMFRHVDLMHRGMDAGWRRHEVHSHNISNNDTPNYKAQSVEFESMLRAAMSSDKPLEGARTNQRHFHIGTPADPTKIEPVTVGHTHFNIRMDDNNVDIDHEMNALAANYIKYSTLQTQVTGSFNRLKMVIREGR